MEDPEDNHNIQAFIKTLCAGDNWRSLMTPENEFLERECAIVEWLHRQLVSRYLLVSFTSLISF
jgi:hypothetical protein